jgi:sulfatase modifying factor 1
VGPPPNLAHDTMALIPGGAFDMGGASGAAHEAPVHEVRVDSFYLDRTEVTVAAFERFARATGYVTEAERVGSSGTFIHALGEWRDVAAASWRHPDGPSSNADPREPVAQVSWQDATAYARWAGKRLPTEAEWERAARGGLSRATYAWGNDLRPNGKLVANFWQGTFPAKDEGEDGFRGRAPVASFPANGFGLHDMTGNVWEWVADFYSESYYADSPHDNPTGPSMGIDRVMRGGSFLCSANFCTNYRVAGRGHGDPHNPLNNVGFRCARSLSH